MEPLQPVFEAPEEDESLVTPQDVPVLGDTSQWQVYKDETLVGAIPNGWSKQLQEDVYDVSKRRRMKKAYMLPSGQPITDNIGRIGKPSLPTYLPMVDNSDLYFGGADAQGALPSRFGI